VNTGSGLKDGTLKSEAFFDVKRNPLITFRSEKIVQTGSDAFEALGDLTIRGVSKGETLTLKMSGRRMGSCGIRGVMVFDRRDYGMTSGIPFIRIADLVEVTILLKIKQVSGPPFLCKR
jgi:polyisoprenoid-binding protein YceI